ncbi:hypothetical protein B0H10DRAFT_2094669, partial [Mycena sp. CBHHK59/15]
MMSRLAFCFVSSTSFFFWGVFLCPRHRPCTLLAVPASFCYFIPASPLPIGHHRHITLPPPSTALKDGIVHIVMKAGSREYVRGGVGVLLILVVLKVQIMNHCVPAPI